MGSPNGWNDSTHTPPPLSFYNTFKYFFVLAVNIDALQRAEEEREVEVSLFFRYSFCGVYRLSLTIKIL
jgi:hypothetical protein